MNITGAGSASSPDDAAQRGDDGCNTHQREFLALLAPCLASLNRFAQAMCRDRNGCDREAAKDVVGETICRAFENFGQVREQKAFQSYLFTIAVRLNRAERKRNAQRQPLSEEHSDIASSAATDAQADIPQLYTALDRLPREQREAIVMSEIVGLSLAEVAEAQHASLSAVKTRVSRGRKRLAKLLGVDDERDQSAYVVSPVSANGSGSYHARFAFQAKEKL